jgi:hypothetical protein
MPTDTIEAIGLPKIGIILTTIAYVDAVPH